VQLVTKDHQFLFQSEHFYNINLTQNYQAEAVKCKGEKDCDKTIIKGKWTSIYDQALDIELENGLRFIANLRYNVKPEVSEDPVKQALTQGVGSFGKIESGDYDKFNSQCNKTMVGFIQQTGKGASTMQNHKVLCFTGEQVQHYDFEKTQAFNTGKVKYNKIVEQKNVQPVDLLKQFEAKQELAAKNVPGKKRRNMHLEHRPSDEMDLLITEINTSDLGWKADVCKYTKTHPLYGKDCSGPLHLAQTNDNSLLDLDESGVVSSDGFGDMKNEKFKQALNKAQFWQKNY
jgi:hypothetical protein